MSKEIKARLQIKNDTAENWVTASTNGFIPKLGEPILYKEVDENGFKFVMKIGDGVRAPENLPNFEPAAITDDEIDEICGGTMTTFLEDIACEEVEF